MEVTTERHGDVLVANVIGRIDPKGAGALQTAITAALQDGDRAVLLDFEQLSYIGNVGVRALRIIARVLRDRGAGMAICSPQGVVAAVFSGSGVDSLISVYPTRAAALEVLND
ncbi:MAG: STAS domain-containing protein [Rhodospirillales bacterium]|nr:STAS domain-containing protein [Rhodospirillales bacterium]